MADMNPVLHRSTCMIMNSFTMTYQDNKIYDLYCYQLQLHLQRGQRVNGQRTYISVGGLVQERRNSIGNALELRLSCTNPSIWNMPNFTVNSVPADGLPPTDARPSVGKILMMFRAGFLSLAQSKLSSDYAQPITGQVIEVTCPVIGRAQPELTPSKRQKTGPGSM